MIRDQHKTRGRFALVGEVSVERSPTIKRLLAMEPADREWVLDRLTNPDDWRKRVAAAMKAAHREEARP